MARYVVTAWYAYVFGAMRGMTAAAAAEKAGINQSAISRWKSGQAPDLRVAVQFARGMGLNVLEALAHTELITFEEAALETIPLDIATVSTEDLLKEAERRMQGYENRTAVRGNGAVGPEGPAGGDQDPGEPQQGLRAGTDRAGEARLGAEVLDRAGDTAALPRGRVGALVSRVDTAGTERLNVSPPTELTENKPMAKTPKGRWAQAHIATILGLEATSWSKLLSGLIYPARLQTMQKIEIVFGWPVSEQVQLIPPYWEWPVQASSGVPNGDPVDMRYAIKLARVVAEWCDANPRTVEPKSLTLHPSLQPINKTTGPRFVAKEEPKPEVPLVVNKPLLRR